MILRLMVLEPGAITDNHNMAIQLGFVLRGAFLSLISSWRD